MWCVGIHCIPHVGQKVNVSIESYHSNLKNILNSPKDMFMGRRMDYHLMGEVVTDYWYGVQCKVFGFICNTKHEGIVVSIIIRANVVLDTNIFICMDADVTCIGLVNNHLKV